MDFQGQSIATPHKLRGIDAAMRMQAVLAKSVFRRFPSAIYFHFDIFAGSGVNDQIPGCEPLPGSPLIAAQSLAASGVPYLMVCVERDRQRAKSLADELRYDQQSFVIEGDNADVLQAVPQIIIKHGERPEKAIGTMLIDPNKPSDVPWDAIREVLTICERLDVIVNYPASAEKRNRYAAQAGVNVDFLHIDQLPKTCRRRFWMIRDAASYGAYKFCLCVGRNHAFDGYKREGFHLWESDDGRLIRSRMMNNAEDHRKFLETMNGQRRLFD